MAQGSNKKIANSLVATGAAAVFAVYAAGYSRTRSAADLFDAQSAERRQPVSDSARPAVPVAPAAITAGASVPVPQPAHDAAITAGASVPVPQPAHDAAVTSAKDFAPAASAKPEPDKPEPVEHASLAPAPSMTQTAESPTPAVPAPPVAAPAPVAVAPIAPAAAAPQPSVAAPAPAPAPPAPAGTAAGQWKDGTYTGWGTCRHGDIQAQVVIQGGRILSANIAQCLTRYSCSVIASLPPEVAHRQSPEVDYVSGATQSANAFYYAVVDALSKAK